MKPKIPLSKVVVLSLALYILGFLIFLIGGFIVASIPEGIGVWIGIVVMMIGIAVVVGAVVFDDKFYRCPHCNCYLTVWYRYHYCPTCGNFLY